MTTGPATARMPAVDAAACLVGRLGPDGPWLGFAPSLDDGYLLVVADEHEVRRLAAVPDDLLCLAIAYFEDALAEPPEEASATHADIGALVRHVADAEPGERRAALQEAVDAIDDGLDGDAVIAALGRCLAPGIDPLGRLARRVGEVTGPG